MFPPHLVFTGEIGAARGDSDTASFDFAQDEEPTEEAVQSDEKYGHEEDLKGDLEKKYKGQDLEEKPNKEQGKKYKEREEHGKEDNESDKDKDSKESRDKHDDKQERPEDWEKKLEKKIKEYSQLKDWIEEWHKGRGDRSKDDDSERGCEKKKTGEPEKDSNNAGINIFEKHIPQYNINTQVAAPVYISPKHGPTIFGRSERQHH